MNLTQSHSSGCRAMILGRVPGGWPPVTKGNYGYITLTIGFRSICSEKTAHGKKRAHDAGFDSPKKSETPRLSSAPFGIFMTICQWDIRGKRYYSQGLALWLTGFYRVLV